MNKYSTLLVMTLLGCSNTSSPQPLPKSIFCMGEEQCFTKVAEDIYIETFPQCTVEELIELGAIPTDLSETCGTPTTWTNHMDCYKTEDLFFCLSEIEEGWFVPILNECSTTHQKEPLWGDYGDCNIVTDPFKGSWCEVGSSHCYGELGNGYLVEIYPSCGVSHTPSNPPSCF